MLSPQLPDYGCFIRWPENGQSFMHPDDVPIANQLIPSPRVLKRTAFDGTYYHYEYGQLRFRLRPTMWRRLRTDGIDIADQVETIGLGLERDRFVADVWGMYFVERKGCILYRLKRAGRVVPRLYPADQLRVLNQKASIRKGGTVYRAPEWDGSGETTSVLSGGSADTVTGAKRSNVAKERKTETTER
ncbi:MAG: hypothetical protein AAGJ83_00960 [Planctomycetota bacterium]